MQIKAGGVLVASLALAACGAPPQKNQKIVTIGAALDRTGPSATPSWTDSIQLAVEHVNTAIATADEGKGEHVQFKVVFADTLGEDEDAKTRAAELVAQGAKVVLAQSSSETSAINSLNYDTDASGAKNTANDLNVPVICAACTSAKLNSPTATDDDPAVQGAIQDADNWMFRTVMNNKRELRISIQKQIADNNGDRNGDGKYKLVVLLNDGLGSFASTVAKTAKELNPNVIVEEVSYDESHDVNDAAYWSGVVDKATDNVDAAQAVDGFPDYVLGNTNASVYVALLNAYRALQVDRQAPVIAVSNFRSPVVVQLLGAKANGVRGTSLVLVQPGANGDRFTQDLKAATGAEPAIEDANFYDAAVTAMLGTLIAARGAGADVDPTQVSGAAIRDALLKTSDTAGTKVGVGVDEITKAVGLIGQGTAINYEGASGPVDYDAVGNVRTLNAFWEVQDQKFVELERFDCIASDDCAVIE